jgi:hypothetical protein
MESRIHPEPALITILVNWLSLYMFDDKIRFCIGGDARVDEFGNVGISQLTENAALTLEPLRARSGHSEPEKLDGHAPLEAAVAALRQPDAAHASLADG